MRKRWLKQFRKIRLIRACHGNVLYLSLVQRNFFKAKSINFVCLFTSFVPSALRQSYFFISALKRKDENLMPENSCFERKRRSSFERKTIWLVCLMGKRADYESHACLTVGVVGMVGSPLHYGQPSQFQGTFCWWCYTSNNR